MKITGFTIELEDRNSLEYALSIKPDDAVLSVDDEDYLRDRMTVLATLYDSSTPHSDYVTLSQCVTGKQTSCRSRKFCSAPFNSEEKPPALQALFGSMLGAAFELVMKEG